MNDTQLQQVTTALADRYRVLRAIGRGGMATGGHRRVERSDRSRLWRTVAIKVPRDRKSGS